MARNDHYVAQTYLRHFAGPSGELVPYYKNGRVVVGQPKRPKSLCFETEGDVNTYFRNHRLLDQFLPVFESRWSGNVRRLENRQLDPNTRYELCAYVAFLRTSNPTAKRIGQRAIAGMLEPVAYDMLRSHVQKDCELDEAARSRLRKAIDNKQIGIQVDREYAHAQRMRTLIGAQHRFYCSRWFILFNDSAIPFVTSDNPAILFYAHAGQQIAEIFVPLKPTLAILICPDLTFPRPTKEDVKRYDTGEDVFGVVKQSYVAKFNEAVVKSAERVVLHHEKAAWLEKLVRVYGRWRTQAVVSHIPTEHEHLVVVRELAVEIEDSHEDDGEPTLQPLAAVTYRSRH